MRRPSKDSSPKLSVESARLIALAQALTEAASRVEQAALLQQLDTRIARHLKSRHDALIEQTLNHLFLQDFDAYDTLMEVVEAQSSACVPKSADALQIVWQAQLVAVPILAWTRFSIPSNTIAAPILVALHESFAQTFLVPEARVCFAPRMHSIDQLPQSYSATLALTEKLAQAAVQGESPKSTTKAPESLPFLADNRFLLGVVLVPQGQPLFAWQTGDNPQEFATLRQKALEQWRESLAPHLSELLPACGVEGLLPQAYYAACREADRGIRPVSIQAAVHYLTHSLSIGPDQLQAVVAGFGDDDPDAPLEEYRIGFSPRQEEGVFYGVVWPLYGQEDEERPNAIVPPHSGYARAAEKKSPLQQIGAQLDAAGIKQVQLLSQRYIPEFCDDCGAPLYPNPQGELEHPEMPEEAEAGGGHLH